MLVVGSLLRTEPWEEERGGERSAMFIGGFVSGLIAQCEISQLLDELFGSLDDDLASLDEAGEEIRERSLALAS